MDVVYPFALSLHLATGTVALASFWTNAAMKKGTPLHRRVGQVYLLAMLGVIVSGVPLAHALVGRGHPVTAIFLAYLILLVAVACWSAWRAIRDRAHPQRYFGGMYWTLTALVGFAGAAVIALGLATGAVILTVFGGVGVVSVPLAIAGWRRRHEPRWWIREHYNALIGCGVATHIAFLGIGLRRLLPGVDPAMLQLLAWFGPLAAAIIAGWWLGRRYGGTRRPVPRRGAPSAA